jgi:lipoate-protein ligase A
MQCIFIETPPLDVYAHMAIDELLVCCLRADMCMARFFNWAQTAGGGGVAATFGYAQFANTARAQIAAAGIEQYTRRPTGGGVVLHKDDLTFSLFFTACGAVKPQQIYGALHAAIRSEFMSAGLALGAYDKQSDYRPAPGGVSASCFANPVSDDLLDNAGAKVLGGAIRRYGDAVLYQGSLQLPAARGSSDYQNALSAAFLKYFNAAQTRQPAGNSLLNEAYALAADVYKTREWIEKF